MSEIKLHWTEADTSKFLYRIGFDFIRQLEIRIEEEGVKQSELAEKLGVTEGRVSQVINNPGNLTLKNVIQYTRALGMKVAIVAYDDGDASNSRGPINSDIFRACWEHCNKPADFFAINELKRQRVAATTSRFVQIPNGFFYISNSDAEPVTNTALLSAGLMADTCTANDSLPNTDAFIVADSKASIGSGTRNDIYESTALHGRSFPIVGINV